MGPHHHEPKETEKDCIEDWAHYIEVIISSFKSKGLMPNPKVDCHKVLKYKE